MKKFTKTEFISLVVIFLILVAISIPNFIESIMKARDQARKDDLGSLVGSLDNYYQDFGEFPASSTDGKIVACIKPGDTVQIDKKGRLVANLVPCEYGKDSIKDLTPGSTKVYLSPLPRDPDFLTKGTTYMYFSNKKRYQIYAHLESASWDEYDEKVIARNIMCGTKVCNMGRSFSKTPIDISIDAYETILSEQYKNEQSKKK